MITVGSLFAGIGGICTGFEQAGCKVLWANELDATACKTYRHNHPNVKMFSGDINKWISLGMLDTLTPVDIITAGFPCQTFSVAGYREGFNDKKGRGNLFFTTARFIQEIQPKAFLLENVKHLINHNGGNTFRVIMDTLEKDLGYACLAFVLNSKDYGNVPQNRERIYIIGFKKEIRRAMFKPLDRLPLTATVASLISPERQADKFYYENHQYYDRLAPDIKKKGTIYQWRRMAYVRENRQGLCPTLTANMGSGGNNAPIVRDDYGVRKLTPIECAGFQGFPKEFSFPDIPVSHQYKQIGNSVTVPVIRRLAEAITEVLK
jgi:DNA (cytosine-5)-methyltransferase 1